MHSTVELPLTAIPALESPSPLFDGRCVVIIVKYSFALLLVSTLATKDRLLFLPTIAARVNRDLAGPA
ncbi:hypothetical protein ABVK25_009448 [Lepraria finkii]|uniref:Uncharacterized protein n=1 Tax=Lepraria finkii TaxID=1340010 RepID=A0ABR4AYF8_9LECA